jgi:hypothetical protein
MRNDLKKCRNVKSKKLETPIKCALNRVLCKVSKYVCMLLLKEVFLGFITVSMRLSLNKCVLYFRFRE